jgi:hypothetical protein
MVDALMEPIHLANDRLSLRIQGTAIAVPIMIGENVITKILVGALSIHRIGLEI